VPLIISRKPCLFLFYELNKRGPFHVHFVPDSPPNARNTGTKSCACRVEAVGGWCRTWPAVEESTSKQARSKQPPCHNTFIESTFSSFNPTNPTPSHPHPTTGIGTLAKAAGGRGGNCCAWLRKPLPQTPTPHSPSPSCRASTALEWSWSTLTI
jgi:hypothetical protein